MNKRILLVEPAYKTKYPPLGLMKIATYHKMKGDEVVFVRGRNKNARYHYWDRIYITTLFTWTWKETVETINFYCETLLGFTGKIFIGGILASLMPDELFDAVEGVEQEHIVEGLLDDSKKIGQDDDINIDKLAPDYEILKQVETDQFKYVNTDSYLGYTTRGCVWNCEFCAVRILEPRYVPYVDMKGAIQEVTEKSGEKQNLMLMDNNVLASSRFDEIIDDIKSLGFVKGATFGKTKRKRMVDFNQGLDARFLTEEKMKRFSEIPLEPMRIAFDFIEYRDIYVQAVRLANKYGQKDMSNYVLYNFKDTPEDFHERLLINADLNEEFKNSGGSRTVIYSYPMRFIPLDAKSRDIDTGNGNWNRRYLRGVQVILNVTRGPVMPGREFFLQAFGRDAEEFKTILLMPDEFIRNRLVPNWKELGDYEKKLMPYVKEWMDTFSALSDKEKTSLIQTLGPNDRRLIKQEYDRLTDGGVRKLLRFHLEDNEIVARHKATQLSRR